MSSLLIKNIKQLVGVNNPLVKRGKDMSVLECIDNAWLSIREGCINDYGPMNKNVADENFPEVLDAAGRLVMPCYCDSHTHIVYAGTREPEFVDRIKGRTYQEIAARGGGILNSVKQLRAASETQLFENAWQRLEEIMLLGTGAVEIKSGYGLNLESELKILRVIRQLRDKSPLTIKSTFLGAHAIPNEYAGNKDGYVDLIINEMLPAVAAEQLADYCDIFCELNYFTSNDVLKILDAAAKHGIQGKIHAEQLSHSNGIKAAVESNAVSVDHLEFCNDEDIALLKNSDTMPTVLPGAQFFLGLKIPPARKIIDAGLPLAIASDYNPGSSPSGNMNMMISIACINYKLTPEESINAATINSAYAMGVSNELGTISTGKKANLLITKKIPSYGFIPYSFGNNFAEKIILNGRLMN